MKFKVDENLPIEFTELLREIGYDATNVLEQELQGALDAIVIEVCQMEKRILVTLDLDFADIRTYPPQEFAGIIVLRTNRQDKPYLISIFQRVTPFLTQEAIEQRLWIVEESQIRIRE